MNNVIITGASSGIGKMIALTVAPVVDNMYFVGRNDVVLSDMVADIKRLYPQKELVTNFSCDLSLSNGGRGMHDLKSFVSSCEGDEKREHMLPTSLIYCAGQFQNLSFFEDTTVDDFKSMFGTNAIGFVNMINLVLPHAIQKNNGKIVYIGSQAAYRGSAFSPAYSASKAAGNMIATSLRSELENRNSAVKVYSLNPGFVEGERLDQRIQERMSFFHQSFDEAFARYKGKTIKPHIVAEKVRDIFIGEYEGDEIEK